MNVHPTKDGVRPVLDGRRSTQVAVKNTNGVTRMALVVALDGTEK